MNYKVSKRIKRKKKPDKIKLNGDKTVQVSLADMLKTEEVQIWLDRKVKRLKKETLE